MKLTKERREELANSNLNLVWEVINNHFKSCDMEFKTELYDVGLLGLAKALDTFNTEAGFVFSTYAYRCIKVEMITYLHYVTRLKRSCYTKVISLDTPMANGEDGDMDSLIDILVVEEDERSELHDSVLTKLSIKGNPYNELKKIVRRCFETEFPEGQLESEREECRKALELYFDGDGIFVSAEQSGVSNKRMFHYALSKAFKKAKTELTEMLKEGNTNETVRHTKRN